MTHPVVGELEMHCDVLYVPERDQRVVLYTTTPGTPSHEAMKLLRVAPGPRTSAPAEALAHARQRSSRLRILPVAVIGSSSRNSTIRGYL